MDKTLLFQVYATDDGLELKFEKGEAWAKRFKPAIDLHGLNAVRWHCEGVFKNLVDSIDECLVKHYPPDDQEPSNG